MKRPQYEQYIPYRNYLLIIVRWQLRAHVYCARDLPPADETGSSDPYVKIQIEDKFGYTKMQPATLNPQWFETVTLDVDLPPFETFVRLF